MLVGLTGYAGAGKDTAAAGLIADGWKRMSFAEPIRQMLLVLNPLIQEDLLTTHRLKDLVNTYGWDETKRTFPEVRRLLQVMGTEVGRQMIDEDLWTILAEKEWSANTKAGFNTVVTDLRFINEANALQVDGGIIVRIHRLGVEPARGHVSDTSVDLIRPDYEIVNNGSPEDLQAALKNTIYAIDPNSVKLNV